MPRADGRREAAPAGANASGPRPRLWHALVASAVIVAAGLAAYSNSFQGPFIFDDTTSIPKNPYIQHLWPIWEAMKAPQHQTAAGRPILSLSLAVNYAVSGMAVWSYHGLNLIIHLASATVLYGIIRRTMLLKGMGETLGGAVTPGTSPGGAWLLALACSLIWLLHPLNTGSVTYIIQRAESLMGLFYLLTLYLAIRGLTSTRRTYWWYGASTLACLIGMFCKEVMFTAPIAVFMYDAVFASRSVLKAGRRHWVLHLCLAATWVPFIAYASRGYRTESVGFGWDISAFDYAATQCNVIMHYLKLAFWPARLSLDYDWPIARQFSQYGSNGGLLVLILVGVLIVLVRRPQWGFLGAWVFLILGPTSSVLPIATEVAAEHRMYLPLVGPVVAVVLGAYALGMAAARRRPALRAPAFAAGCAACVALAGLFGWMTHRRNFDYRSDAAIWRDATQKVPGNGRAFHNLAVCQADQGRNQDAIDTFSRAIELKPNQPEAFAHRGISYSAIGQYDKAVADFQQALKLDPGNSTAQIGLGVAADKTGNADLAMDRFRQAVQEDPKSAVAWSNLGSSYHGKGKYDQALECFDKAIQLDPKLVNAWANRGAAYSQKGQFPMAIADYSKAIELDAGNAKALSNRGAAYENAGQPDKALADYSRAIQLDPRMADAYTGRAAVYERAGDHAKAVADCDKAIELAPQDAAGYAIRGSAYSSSGQYDQAIADMSKVVELQPNAPNYNSRGMLYGMKGEYEPAVADFNKAIGLEPAYAPAYSNRGMAFMGLGRNDAAAADLARATELSPALVSPYVNLATARGRMRDYRGAIESLQAALTVAQTNQPDVVGEIRRRIEAYTNAANTGAPPDGIE